MFFWKRNGNTSKYKQTGILSIIQLHTSYILVYQVRAIYEKNSNEKRYFHVLTTLFRDTRFSKTYTQETSNWEITGLVQRSQQEFSSPPAFNKSAVSTKKSYEFSKFCSQFRSENSYLEGLT